MIRNALSATILGMIVGLFAFFVVLPITEGAAQSQQQTMPQGQMPMMGPGQGRWMWPRQGGTMGHRPGQWMGPGMGPWMGRGYSMVRHMYYMHNGLPPAYRGKHSSLISTPDAVRDGAVLYAENCALCHGAQGFGDGEGGRDLNPPPANLAYMIRMPMLNDEYMLWTIAEGGEPLGTGMPAYKETLTEEQIWKIVAAMRAGFPSPTPSEGQVGTAPQTGSATTGGLVSPSDVRTQLDQWVLWYGNPDLKVGSVTEKDKSTFVAEIVTQDGSVVQRIEIDRRTGWMRSVP